jgi:large subunit ribosomal protein L24
MKMRIKKNDTVKVLYGKDAGKTGKVLRVLLKEGKIVVEGANIYKRHLKGDGKTRQSEIVDLVKPMPISKVMLVCPACKKNSRVGIEKTSDGKKMRICKKCNKSVDNLAKEETEKSEKTDKKKDKKDDKKKSNK